MLSASRLDLAEHCLYPWTSGIPWSHDSSDASRYGTAVHEWAESAANGEPAPFDQLAATHELSDRDRQRLEDIAVDLGELIEADREAGSLIPEIRIAYDPLHGTSRVLRPTELRQGGEMELRIDLLVTREADESVIVRDWKTGRRPLIRRVAETLQVRTYAVAVAKAFDLDSVKVEIAWLSDRGIWVDHARLDAFDLAVAEEDLRALDRLRREGREVPVYGLHCAEHHCPIAGQCHAAAAAAERVAQACESAYPFAGHLTDIADEGHALEILRLLPLVRARADAAEEALREWVSRNGALDLRDGRAWGPVERQGNDRLEATDRACEIIAEHLGEHAQSAVEVKRTVTKASLDRGLKALVREEGEQKKRGALKARRDRLHQDLRACGALRPGAAYTKFEPFKREVG